MVKVRINWKWLICLLVLVFYSCDSKKNDKQGLIISNEKDSVQVELEEILDNRQSLIDSTNSAIANSYAKNVRNDSVINSGIEILEPIAYHGDELEEGVEEGEWLVIESGEIPYNYPKMKLAIELVEDPILDKPGEQSAKLVKVENLQLRNVPTYLIKGINNESKDIKVVGLGKRCLTGGEQVNMNFFNQEGLTLKAFGNTKECYPEGSFYFVLTDGKKEQVIAGGKTWEDAYMRILWLGDLDGDNQIDLLIDSSNHYNLSRIDLFLSSFAEDDEFVRLVARRESVGC